MPFITNEGDASLKTKITELLVHSKELKFLVGFFYFSGIRELYTSLRDNPESRIDVLVGLSVDKTLHGLVEFAEPSKGLSNNEIFTRFLNSISRSINSDDFDNREFYEQSKFFINAIKNDRLRIRKTLDPNHAKLYIFKIKDELTTLKKACFITGSSNLTSAGLSHQNEFNVEISDYGVQEAEDYFDELWKDAVKITEHISFKTRLLHLLEQETLVTEITPYEAFALVLKTYVEVQEQKVVALRKYLNRSSKSDKIDSLTLAKMPFIDPEKLEEIYLPSGKIYAIQRLARQRKPLESEIAGHKKRIGSIVDGHFPGIRIAFSDPWSAHARAFLHSRLNPLTVVRAGEKALCTFLTKARRHCRIEASVESHGVYLACREAATLYKASSFVRTIDDDFFSALQDEISRELRLMEIEEAESAAIAKRLEKLYLELHPSDNLRTIPGVGNHTAPVFLATIGNPARFRSQSSFANYCGVVPGANQSSGSEAKGLRMTKAGPPIMRWALFQAGQIGRSHDPQLACVYYREMVHNGKNHMQAMGAVMSHLSARY